MSGGRTEFETIVAQAPRKSLKAQIITLLTSVDAGTTENYDFFSSTSTVAKLQNLVVQVTPPNSATTGTHTFYLGGGYGQYLQMQNTNAAQIYFNNNSDAGGGLTLSPDDPAAFQEIIKNTYFDNAIAMRFTYSNNTDKQQTNARIYKIIYIEETVKG